MNEINYEKIVGKYKPDKTKDHPFKIKCSLMAPIVMAHPWLHLDGILAHLVLRKILGPLFYTLPTNTPIDFFDYLNLPLKKYIDENFSFYHGSISFFKQESLSTTTIYKRFHERDLSHLDTKRKKVSTRSGTLKDHAIKLPNITTNTVLFYGNGNVKEIQNLLEGLPGLGKKIAIGFGFIKNIIIKETHQDHSIIKDNITMRPLPINLVEPRDNLKKVILGFRFPYWAKNNITLCVPPGEKIWMRDGLKLF